MDKRELRVITFIREYILDRGQKGNVKDLENTMREAKEEDFTKDEITFAISYFSEEEKVAPEKLKLGLFERMKAKRALRSNWKDTFRLMAGLEKTREIFAKEKDKIVEEEERIKGIIVDMLCGDKEGKNIGLMEEFDVTDTEDNPVEINRGTFEKMNVDELIETLQEMVYDMRRAL